MRAHTTTASEHYKVRLATSADFDSIMTLISEEFLHEETMHSGYVIHNRGQYALDLNDHLFRCMKKYFSEQLLTVNPALVACQIGSDQIVGFMVLQTPNFPNIEQNFAYCSPRSNQRGALSKLNYYHYDIAQNAYLYAHFPETDKHLLLMYLVVHKSHRRKRLGIMMLRQSIEYAKSHGYDLVYGIFTSKKSKKAAEKVGMTSIYDVDLRAVVDHQEKPAFADMGENNVVSVMVIKIR